MDKFVVFLLYNRIAPGHTILIEPGGQRLKRTQIRNGGDVPWTISGSHSIVSWEKNVNLYGCHPLSEVDVPKRIIVTNPEINDRARLLPSPPGGGFTFVEKTFLNHVEITSYIIQEGLLYWKSLIQLIALLRFPLILRCAEGCTAAATGNSVRVGHCETATHH